MNTPLNRYLRSKIDFLIISLLTLTIVIDLITGVILLSNPDAQFTPGILMKLMLVLLLLVSIKITNVVSISSIIILSISTIFATLNDSLLSLTSNLISATKLFLFVLVFYYLMNQLKIGKLSTKNLYRISLFSYLVIIFNQIAGLAGFGKITYHYLGENVGTSGFFFETNSYSILIIIITALLYFYLHNKSKNWILIIILFSSVVLCFSIATKVAIIGSLILPLIILFSKNKKYFIFLIIASSVFVYSFNSSVSKIYSVEKILNSIDGQDSNSTLLSGRIDRVNSSIYDYFELFTPLEQIIGIGSVRMLSDKIKGGTAETDYIDILKMSGLIGFLIVYGTFGWVCFLQYRNYKKNKILEFKIVLILNIFFVLISSTAGHLFASGSATIFLAILNIYPFIIVKERVENNISSI